MYRTTTMSWTAMVTTPRAPFADTDVTVLMRVTYNTLEAIIRDESMFTESLVAH